jgi:hypothetical protein
MCTFSADILNLDQVHNRFGTSTFKADTESSADSEPQEVGPRYMHTSLEKAMIQRQILKYTPATHDISPNPVI